jgi:prephenate dehydrogenase
LAGRETSGPGSARSDLFSGRPWVLTPTDLSSEEALTKATELVGLVGALPVQMEAHEHDQAVALVSHVPQLMASLTAARLSAASERTVSLSGQGIRDVTRIAASDPLLWTDILLANARPVAQILRDVVTDLERLIGGLEALPVSWPGQLEFQAATQGHASVDRPGASAADESSAGNEIEGSFTNSATPSPEIDTNQVDQVVRVVQDVLVAGNVGRGRIPGKHGAPPTTYAAVPVVVSDRPGELARLLTAAGDAGVNVEDVAIEHSPGQQVGLVQLMVSPPSMSSLATALRSGGWTVHV